MRSRAKIYVKVLLAFALLLVGCSGKEKTEQTPEKPVETIVEKHQKQDTVWLETERTNSRNWSTRLDTTIFINKKAYYLLGQVTLNGKEFSHDLVRKRNDTTYVQKLVGPDLNVKITLYNSEDDIEFSQEFTKSDLINEENAPFLTAASPFSLNFKGYHEKFNAVLFSPYIGYPESDNLLITHLFIDLDGELRESFTEGHSFSVCDCDNKPSPDGKIIPFCGLLLHSDFNHIKIGQDREEKLAGLFQVGNETAVAIYTFQGKPPYYNGQIIDKNGRVIKTFDFEGIAGDMSYSIPHFRVDNNGAQELYLFNEVQNTLLLFSSKQEGVYKPIKVDDLADANEMSSSDGEWFNLLTLENSYYFYWLNGKVFKKD